MPNKFMIFSKLRFKTFWEKQDLKSFDDVFENKIRNKRINHISDLSVNTLNTIPVYDQSETFVIGYHYGSDFYNSHLSILFGDHTRILKKIEGKAFFKGDGVKVIKSNHYNNNFLFYYLTNKKIENLGYSRHFKLLKEFYFYIPENWEEQTKIANFFTLLDKQIQLMERKLELYELRKKYYLNNMFSSINVIIPKIRFQNFKENFSSIILNDIITKDYVLDSEANLFYDAPSIMNYKAKIFSGEKHKLAPEKSIIFIKDGSNCGSFLYIEKSSKMASTCEFIKTNQNNEYIYYLLKRNENIIKAKLIIGETIPHLYKSELTKSKISIFIHIEEQTKIANFFSLLDKNIKNTKNKKDQLTKRKTYYLNNMFV